MRLVPEFIARIDWEALRKQKSVLAELATLHVGVISAERKEAAEGLLSLLDALMDWAVDDAGYTEAVVFGSMRHELDEEAKKRYIASDGTACAFCGSDQIESVTGLELIDHWPVQRIACQDCGALWQESYALSEIEVVKAPRNHSHQPSKQPDDDVTT